MKAPRHCGRGSGRRRTAEEIRSILQWHERSGLSLLAFARQQGLCYATLRRWRAVREEAAPGPELSPQAAHPQFVAVELEPAARPGEFILEWSAGRSLRIPAGFAPDQLRRLLDVLGVRP